MPLPHAPIRDAASRTRMLGLALLLIVALAACDDPTGPLPRSNPLAGVELYVPYPSSASRQVELWRETRPADAAAIERIAREPRGVWLADPDPGPQIRATLDAAETEGTVPVLVAYFIPRRDCTSAGATDADTYRSWVRDVAAALRGRPIVILEPDALAAAECVPDPAERYDLLAYGARTLAARGARVYIDAGHPRWLPAGVTAERLRNAGIEEATGFSLNVANFIGTAENVAYGQTIAEVLGGTGFVIDTSRNGAGTTPDNEWCNPPGRKLGTPPTTNPPQARVDALLWIKRPGESDGRCNGGPPAGEWWPEYALELAR